MKSKWPKYLFILVLIGIVIFAYFKIKGEEEIKNSKNIVVHLRMKKN